PQGFAFSTFGALLLCYIPCDVRNADDTSQGVPDWRDCLRHLKNPPVFSSPFCFVMFDGLSATYASQNLWFFVSIVFWKKDGDWFSYYLRRGIAKEFFRSGVPGCHDSIQSFADDCIFREFDKSPEERFRDFRLLPSLPFRDVPGDLRSPYNPADAIANRRN